MIKLKTITLKNFLSVGAVTQSIVLNNSNLTLILGENLDMGGEGEGARNGVGKTTLLQALSYGLYGAPINSIKRDNLINRINEKNMVVSVDFSVGNQEYKIVRGRKPNILKFYVNNVEQQNDEGEEQGENRETQAQIESILGMSADMFQHIIGLNSYTTPFLSLKAADQRTIIEQLLGITILSERAATIKELNRSTKEAITQEEYKLKGIQEANQRITEQIQSLERRSDLWSKKHSQDLEELVNKYESMTQLDIAGELAAHKKLSEWLEQKRMWDTRNSLLDRQQQWLENHTNALALLESKLTTLSSVDIVAELAAHVALREYNARIKLAAELERSITTTGRELSKEQGSVKKFQSEIDQLQQHRCYACGQEFHDKNHSVVLEGKIQALADSQTAVEDLEKQLEHHQRDLTDCAVSTQAPTTHYPTEQLAFEHNSEVIRIQKQIQDKKAECDPYAEQIAEIVVSEPGTKPTTHYATEALAIEHSSTVSLLETQIKSKSDEINPYIEQIEDMKQNALQELDYEMANQLTTLLRHQEYLLDLLTNKKSFIRKKIIDQNLGYLNNRLSHYLQRMGLPHSVVFQNDLTVDITDFGRECDFDSLSRGERNRLILSLSFAFRDVWENLYNSVNMMFIDELMDSGMDSAGVENGLHLLKDFSRNRNKSVWLVSHRDELVTRVSNILKVVKENGYTTFALEDKI